MRHTSEFQSTGGKSETQRWRVLIVVSAIVFVAEFGLDLLMDAYSLPPAITALLQSFVLSTVTFFALLSLLLRPFARYEREIERHRVELESRVAKRTSDLARYAAILDAPGAACG
jgi:C4-dicarboxylate-specific signal transduction histidine kinase